MNNDASSNNRNLDGSLPSEAGDAEPLPTAPYGNSALGRARQLLDEVPTQVGPFRILERIGQGGMGDVLRAEQREPIRREVALKLIKLGMDTKQVLARFEAERQALAMMDHPHIAKVFEASADQSGRPYFVMEYVRGKPITEYADQNHLSIPERLDLFCQVCNAIQHAHHKGIIHRDIKPSNVLVSTQDGKPFAKVIDFGIAKATATQLTDRTLYTLHDQFIGTPQYMSPEQAEGSADIDTRTDVYSLGVLLYELLTGSTPFGGAELRDAAIDQVKRIIRESEPPKPSTRLSQSGPTLPTLAAARRTEPAKLGTIVRGELDWIVMSALEKDRRRRYDTPNSFADDVQRYLKGEPVEAAPPSRAYQLSKFVRRHSGPVVAATLLLCILIAATTIISHLAWRLGSEVVSKNAALGEAERAQGEADKQRREAEGKNDALEWLAYSNAMQLAQKTFDQGDIELTLSRLEACPLRFRGWEWKSLRAKADSSVKLIEFAPHGEVLAFSQDGEAVFFASSRNYEAILTLVSSLDGSTLGIIKLPAFQRILAADVSRNGERVCLLVATKLDHINAESVIHVWDRSAGKVIWSAPSSVKETGDLFGWPSVSLCASGTRVAVGGLNADNKESIKEYLDGKDIFGSVANSEYKFSSSNGRMLLDVLGDGSRSIVAAPADASLSPSGRFLVADFPRNLIYDIEKKESASAPLKDEWEYIGFVNDDRNLLVRSADGKKLLVYDPIKRGIEKELPSRSIWNSPLSETISSTGTHIAYRKGQIGITETAESNELVFYGTRGYVNSLHCNLDSSRIVALSGAAATHFPLPDHAHFLRREQCQLTNCIALPDARHVIGLKGKMLLQMVASTGEIVSTLCLPKEPSSLAISPDGKHLATCLADKTLLWDLAVGPTSMHWVRRGVAPGDSQSVRYSVNPSRLAILSSNYRDPSSTYELIIHDTVTGSEISRTKVNAEYIQKIVALTDHSAWIVKEGVLSTIDCASGAIRALPDSPQCSNAAVSWKGDRIALFDRGRIALRSFPGLKPLTPWRDVSFKSADLDWLIDDSRVVATSSGDDANSIGVLDSERGEVVLEAPQVTDNKGNRKNQYALWGEDLYISQAIGPWTEVPLRERWDAIRQLDQAYQVTERLASMKYDALVRLPRTIDGLLQETFADDSLSPTMKYIVGCKLQGLAQGIENRYASKESLEELLDEIVATDNEGARFRLVEEIWSDSPWDLIDAGKEHGATLFTGLKAPNSGNSTEDGLLDAALLYRRAMYAEAISALEGLPYALTPTRSEDALASSRCHALRAMAEYRLGKTEAAGKHLHAALRYWHVSEYSDLQKEAAQLVDPEVLAPISWTPSAEFEAAKAIDSQEIDDIRTELNKRVTVKGYVVRAVPTAGTVGANLFLNEAPKGLRVWIRFDKFHDLTPALMVAAEHREIIVTGEVIRYDTGFSDWQELEIIPKSVEDIQILDND